MKRRPHFACMWQPAVQLIGNARAKFLPARILPAANAHIARVHAAVKQKQQRLSNTHWEMSDRISRV